MECLIARSSATPGDDFPCGGVHAAAADAQARQARFHPVVHLFHLAQQQAELAEYFTGLAHDESREYSVRMCGRTAGILLPTCNPDREPRSLRAWLAGTLAANYGIYARLRAAGARPARTWLEEYRDSEKYEIKDWDRDSGTTSRADPRVNAIRRTPIRRCEKMAAAIPRHRQSRPHLLFEVDAGFTNVIVCIVNLDPRHRQSGWTDLALAELGIDAGEVFEVHDLLTDARYRWQGSTNFVELRPTEVPAHVFRVLAPTRASTTRLPVVRENP